MIGNKDKDDALLYIRSRLDTGELLSQLAEECAELGKAALKLRRTYNSTNPTPVTRSQAAQNLAEEIADVTLIFEALRLDPSEQAYETIRELKAARWASRLKEAEGSK